MQIKSEYILYKLIINQWSVGFTKPMIEYEILANSQHYIFAYCCLLCRLIQPMAYYCIFIFLFFQEDRIQHFVQPLFFFWKKCFKLLCWKLHICTLFPLLPLHVLPLHFGLFLSVVHWRPHYYTFFDSNNFRPQLPNVYFPVISVSFT